MFLSMVSAPNYVGIPSRDTFAQRFNVAASAPEIGCTGPLCQAGALES